MRANDVRDAVELPAEGLSGLARWWRAQEADLASAARSQQDSMPSVGAASEAPVSVRSAVSDFAAAWAARLRGEAAMCGQIARALDEVPRSLGAVDEQIAGGLTPGGAARG